MFTVLITPIFRDLLPFYYLHNIIICLILYGHLLLIYEKSLLPLEQSRETCSQHVESPSRFLFDIPHCDSQHQNWELNPGSLISRQLRYY